MRVPQAPSAQGHSAPARGTLPMAKAPAPPAPHIPRPPLPVPFYYGWVIAVLCAVTMAVVYGFRYSFSVFFVAILDEFGWDRASTAGILSANILVYGAVVALIGALVDRSGPRLIIPAGAAILSVGILLSSRATELWHFYLLFGGVCALGLAMSGYVPNFVVLTNWFVRRRGAAFGVAQAGSGGSFLLAGLAQLLIAWYGWRSSYVIMAVAFGGAVVLLTAFLVRRRPQDVGLTPDGETAPALQTSAAGHSYTLVVVDEAWANTRWTARRAVATGRFWTLFCANLLIWGFGFALVVTHQAAYARDVGHSAEVIALMVGIYGLVNLAGNLCGFLVDRHGREPVYTLGGAAAALGILALILASDPSRPWLLLAYSALMGFGLGLVAPAATAAHADLFQGPNFGVINGLIVTSFGLGGSLAPWLAGFIYDNTHNYLPAFIFSLVAVVAACGLIWVARPSAVRAVRRTGLSSGAAPGK
ncbi:MAG: MFS transporter [Chloroflexi bacterium]|nr:MFS transporter [Chloroflexota bacterium]